ncbi:hypothetical protein SISSUDRAFT_562719 [Sistotremastrum suecicum HHB10207 ss-3]|uniref:Uncharacterized protein n=1 Tax=Sistotremastrum suecicum HHB10207 ss-3 TaxID=1314776 RepID=A0A166ET44_9AGAM|nr:hypothetical protein SISSUDRAFT_562719 [Sistotremastrum suecicum HHB10207 ss-3]
MVCCPMGPREGGPPWSGSAQVDEADPGVVKDQTLPDSRPPETQFTASNQPMVKLSTLETLSKANIQVRLDNLAQSSKPPAYSGLYASSVPETFGGLSAFSAEGNAAQSPSDIQASERETEDAINPGAEGMNSYQSFRERHPDRFGSICAKIPEFS